MCPVYWPRSEQDLKLMRWALLYMYTKTVTFLRNAKNSFLVELQSPHLGTIITTWLGVCQ